MARPYAHIITTLQISQMGVGLTVNAFAIYYQSLGENPLISACSCSPLYSWYAPWLMHVARPWQPPRRTIPSPSGHECHTNKTNTILSWLMYASYFVLFGLLYLKNYILGKPATAKRKKEQ